MGIRDLLFVGVVLGGVAAIGAGLYPPRLDARNAGRPAPPMTAGRGIDETVRRVNEAFRRGWAEDGLTPARPAPELAVLRRLSLAMTGTVPSLQELRGLETAPSGRATARYLDDLLADRRFSDYFAERLGRAYVGTEGGPFLVFRRRRFVSWLSDALLEDRPYDRVVRDLIASDGLWTDRPATNFLTVTFDPDKKIIDPDRVAGRVARAFIGAPARLRPVPRPPVRPLDPARLSRTGRVLRPGPIGSDRRPRREERGVRPGQPQDEQARGRRARVPLLPELLPAEGKNAGTRRDRLARWVTDPKNPGLARATVNRVWALMLGRPMVEPVNDFAAGEDLPEPLTVLADDFIAHGFDLHRLIRAIAATEVFGLDSTLPSTSETLAEAAEKAWAVFPLTRLRPEQVVGGMLQSACLTTIDADSPILLRVMRFGGENDFVKRYGDSGEDEFDGRAGTIPQRLLMMNGDLVRDRTKPEVLNASFRIASFAPDDRAAVEVSYLTTLTRKPTPEESRHFEARLAGAKGKDRQARVSDLIWTLVNSSEFSWNH